jgi:hypothetical protein
MEKDLQVPVQIGRLRESFARLELVLVRCDPYTTDFGIVRYEARIRGISDDVLQHCMRQYREDRLALPPTAWRVTEYLFHYARKEKDPRAFYDQSLPVIAERAAEREWAVAQRYRTQQQEHLARLDEWRRSTASQQRAIAERRWEEQGAYLEKAAASERSAGAAYRREQQEFLQRSPSMRMAPAQVTGYRSKPSLLERMAGALSGLFSGRVRYA